MKHRLMSFVNQLLRAVDLALVRCPRELSANSESRLESGVRHAIADNVLNRIALGGKYRFLQIGAHQASGSGEPVRLSSVCPLRRGVLVEPQPVLASRLRERFGGDSTIEVLQCAVGRVPGRAEFYFVDDPDGHLPQWLSEVASFSRGHIEKFVPFAPSLDKYIRRTEVEVKSPAEICEAAGLEALDLLLVDVEGWDWNVIEAFPFAKVPVSMVVFEHCHLSKKDRRAAIAFLAGLGYRMSLHLRDVIAVKGQSVQE